MSAAFLGMGNPRVSKIRVKLRSTLIVALLGACTRNGPAPNQEVTERPSAADSKSPVKAAEAATVKASLPTKNAAPSHPIATFQDALRVEDWRRAATLIDALEPEARAEAIVRFARAYAAFRLSDHETAIEALDGLERRLPSLHPEIERIRAECHVFAGSHDLAAKYFTARADAESMLKVALALERGGETEGAFLTLNRLLSKRNTELEVEVRARALRARLAEQRDRKQYLAQDLSWLVTRAPGAEEAVHAEEQLDRLGRAHALDKQARLERARKLADAGDLELTQRELEKLEKAPGPAVKKRDLLEVEGMAFYNSRRDYTRAAELLDAATQAGGPRQAQNWFYAARALSRAHEDDRALARYEALVKRFPGGVYAEPATYFAARLKYILGRFPDAVAAYDAYERRYGRSGRYADSARYERTVARLASGKHSAAARDLRALIDRERDDRKRARYRELLGVALVGSGEREKAAGEFRRVVSDQPLSLAALFAAARLKSLDLPVPAPIEPGGAKAAAPAPAVTLPSAVELLHGAGLSALAEERLRDSEVSLRKAAANRASEALCGAYGKLSVARRRYQIGQSAASWSALESAPDAETRWLWDCIYPRPYETFVRFAEERTDLPRNLVYAVMRQESAFAAQARSPAFAQGLMQLISPTARRAAAELGYEPADVETAAVHYNVELGAHYLRKLLDGFAGSLCLAVPAYNAGPHAVARWLAREQPLPADLFVAAIPYGETREYAYRVLGNYARYQYMDAGAEGVTLPALELPKVEPLPANAY
jgi:soluble lytic murein transglycosylase